MLAMQTTYMLLHVRLYTCEPNLYTNFRRNAHANLVVNFENPICRNMRTHIGKTLSTSPCVQTPICNHMSEPFDASLCTKPHM